MKPIKIGFPIVLAALILMAAFLTSCAGIQFTEDPEDAYIAGLKVAGRRLAYYGLKAHPDMIPEAEETIGKVISVIGNPEEPVSPEVIKAAIEEIAGYLAETWNDPLLKDDVATLMELVKFSETEPILPAQYQGYMLAFAEGFKLGIDRLKLELGPLKTAP